MARRCRAFSRHGGRGALAERARRGSVRSQATFSTPRSASPWARCRTATFPLRTRRSRFSFRPRLFVSPAASSFTTCSMRRRRRAGHGARVENRAPYAARARGAAWPMALARRRAAHASWASTASCPIPSTTATAVSGFSLRFGCCSGSMRETSAWFGFAAGAALCVPLFFKQNMGLPLLLVAVVAVLLSLALNGRRQNPPPGPARARCSPFLPARAPRSRSPCLRSIGRPASATTFTGQSSMPGSAACPDSASC